MSHKHAHLMRSIFQDPPSANIHWREIESLLAEATDAVRTLIAITVAVNSRRPKSVKMPQPLPRPVDELASAAGFNSLSAFYSCFRRHTGQSPKAYLKQISLRARTHDKP